MGSICTNFLSPRSVKIIHKRVFAIHVVKMERSYRFSFQQKKYILTLIHIVSSHSYGICTGSRMKASSHILFSDPNWTKMDFRHINRKNDSLPSTPVNIIHTSSKLYKVFVNAKNHPAFQTEAGIIVTHLKKILVSMIKVLIKV